MIYSALWAQSGILENADVERNLENPSSIAASMFLRTIST